MKNLFSAKSSVSGIRETEELEAPEGLGCVYGCCTGIASSFWGAAPQDTLQALHGAGSWCVLEERGSPQGWAGQVSLGRLRLPWAPPAPAPASCQPGPASQLPIPQPHKAQVLPDTKPGCLNLALLSPQFKPHLWQGWRLQQRRSWEGCPGQCHP